MSASKCHSVAILERSDDHRAFIKGIYPDELCPKISGATDTDVAHLCFPPNCYSAECSDFFFVKLKGDDGSDLYGSVFFVPETNVPCGLEEGRMVSILLISTEAHFVLFRPFLSAAASLYLSDSEAFTADRVLHDLFAAASTLLDGGKKTTAKTPSLLTLGAHVFCVPKPLPLEPHEFGGASLLYLCERFRMNTMHLFYALVTEQRLLVSHDRGSSEQACLVSLSLPLLLGPVLGGLVKKYVVPTISVEKMDPMLRETYVCGTSCEDLPAKVHLWDVLANARTGGVVWTSKHRLSGCFANNATGPAARTAARSMARLEGKDRRFMSYVLHGIERGCGGEAWVRAEFEAFVRTFLWGARVTADFHATAAAPSAHPQQPARKKKKHLPPHSRSKAASCSDSSSFIKGTGANLHLRVRSASAAVGLARLRSAVQPLWQHLPARGGGTSASERVLESFVLGNLWLEYRLLQAQPSPASVERVAAAKHEHRLRDDEERPPPLPKRPSSTLLMAH